MGYICKKTILNLLFIKKKKNGKNRDEKVMGCEKIKLGTPLYAHTRTKGLSRYIPGIYQHARFEY